MKMNNFRKIVRWFVTAVSIAMFCMIGTAYGEQVALDAAMANAKALADQKQTAYLRVAMTGLEQADAAHRTPVNVAIVLDRSGSMQGEKIAKAKEAACMLVERLRADDIVSVVAYDSTVSVLVPATRASNKEEIVQGIRNLVAGSNTALFAGVSKGASEVRKFLDRQHVNRMILLSDGLANEGPSSPGVLGELGASLIREGISVTTIGLGRDYNEDLMTALAQKSDGNHVFAERPEDLVTAFNREFGDVTTVVAQDVRVTVRCGDGIRPIRVPGREADIVGQTVSLNLNQLYSGQMKYLVIEVELPARHSGEGLRVADVDLSYANMTTKAAEHLARTVLVDFSDSKAIVDASENRDVMVSVVEQISVDNNRMAMRLRDEGKSEEGLRVLQSNVDYLKSNAARFDSPELRSGLRGNGSAVIRWMGGDWDVTRKGMKSWQHQTSNQQGVQGLYVQTQNVDGGSTGRVHQWGTLLPPGVK
jgi:Ca-activated chloride channel family protein